MNLVNGYASRVVSFTPGFSPVSPKWSTNGNRFNGFPVVCYRNR
jgi:hypothetical protein